MRLAIIGLGLIGGSFALALRAAGAAREVVAFDADHSQLDEGLRLCAVTHVAATPADAVANADVVLIAVPVRAMESVFAAIASALSPRCLVMDAGSTKASVAASARRALGTRIAQFVPAHPIAGAEKSGVAAAHAELFLNRHAVLAPLAETDPAMIERATQLWELAHARVVRMDVARHDAIFSAVSHLPHVLSFALVEELARRDNAGELFRFAASGFRDFTRIAASSPEMWRDIALANREALLADLDRYRAALDVWRAAIDQSDAAKLEALMQTARDARKRWQSGGYE